MSALLRHSLGWPGYLRWVWQQWLRAHRARRAGKHFAERHGLYLKALDARYAEGVAERRRGR